MSSYQNLENSRGTTPRRVSSSTTLKAVPAQVFRLRWPEQALLREARVRAKRESSAKDTQAMLASLLVEALWTEEEFIEALCQDVRRQGSH